MIPSQKSTMVPALEILRDGSLSARDLVGQLAVRFGLTDEEANRRNPSGGCVFDKRVRFGLYDLKQTGLLDLENGRYSVTKAGKKALDSRQDIEQAVRRNRQKSNEAKEAIAARRQVTSGSTESDQTSGGRHPMPTRREAAVPIMDILRDDGSANSKYLTDELARRFSLTDKEKNRRYLTGHRMFGNRVRWALYDLKSAGLVSFLSGEYSLTEEGRNLVARNPSMDVTSLSATVKMLNKGIPLEEIIERIRRKSREKRAIPHHKELTPQVLEISKNGQGFRIKDLKERLAARLGLTREESNQKLPSGNDLLYHRSYQAAMYLVRASLFTSKSHLYSITKAGKEMLDQNYDRTTGRLSEDLSEQILAAYKNHNRRKSARRRKRRTSSSKRSKRPKTTGPVPEPNGRMGIPRTEDRLNEFKEFYQYDPDIERLPPDMSTDAMESAISSIKRKVQARFAAAVCAFGNADGGTVYLGIRADGTIRGLEKGKKIGGFSNYDDDFANNIESRLEDLIKDEVFVIRNVKIEFMPVEGKTVCRVRVEPSKRPLYLHIGKEQQFWVRGSAPRSKRLTGLVQAQYLEEHFRRHVQ